MVAALVVCAVGSLTAPGAFASGAGSVYVAASGGSDGNPCTSNSPCSTINQALTQAGDDGYSSPTVYVSGTLNQDNIYISGSQFAGTVTIAQNPAQGAAQADIKAVYADHGPVFVVEAGATAQFTGVTIDGIGASEGGDIDDSSSSSVTATDVTFQGSSTLDGGAIFVQGGGPVSATNDVFDHTGAEGGSGGAIYEYAGGPLNVTGSTFDYDTSGGGDGGAIGIDDSASVTLTNSTFAQNDASANGGALANDGTAHVTIGGTTFYRNEAGESAGANADGGAIYTGSSTPAMTVYGSTFDANTAQGYGFLGSANASTYGNTLYAASGAAHPQFTGDLIYGSCNLNNDAPAVDAYDVASDSSCLPGAAASDVISTSTGDLNWNDPGITPTTPLTPPADVPGAANPAVALLPTGTALGQTTMCPVTDADGVASSGSTCNAGASQATDARPSLYVAGTGTVTGADSGSCTSGAPCATIAYALGTQNQYSDPTVYVSGVVIENGIDITQDATITDWPSGPDGDGEIDGNSSGTNPNFQISGGTVTVSGLAIDMAGAGAIVASDPDDTLTFSNDTFADDLNNSLHEGGAIDDLGGGTIDVSGDTFSSDSASTAGGAIWTGAGGTINVSASSFTDASSAYGGAIAIDGSSGGTVHISDGSTFTSDTASSAGGAIASSIGSGTAGTVTVSDSSFSDDTATYGSAIINGYANPGNASLTVSDTVFYNDGSPTNSSYAYGGAIENAYSNGHGTANITGSTFYEDGAYDGGGAIDNGTSSGTGTLTVLDSTLIDDSVHGGSQLINNDTSDGVTVAGDIFSGSCAENGTNGFGANVTDDGYNVSTDSTCTNGNASDVGVASEGALDLGTPNGGNSETFKPTFSSPAAGIIPASAEAGSTSICGFTDILGNTGPTFTGKCNAGAVQAYTPLAPTGAATNVGATAGVGEATVTWAPPSASAAGGEITDFIVTPHNQTTGQSEAFQTTTGNVDSLLITGLTEGDSYTFTVVIHNSVGSGPASAASTPVEIESQLPTTTTPTPGTPTTTTPTPTTSTTTTPVKPPSTTSSTAATVGNHKLTLVSPTTNTCLATSKRATVKLASVAIPKSKAAKTTFVRAVFTLAGKQSTTVKRLPASISFKLIGLKKGRYTVKVVVTLHETVRKRTTTVKKTLNAPVSVC
jgi:hypothetical protein